LQRILPLAKKVADEIVSDETDILKELIPRMLEVMYRVAKFSCDYVKRGRWSSSGSEPVLMIAARKGGGPGYLETIERMNIELTKVIEDFDRAVNVEALHLASETSECLFPQSGDSSFSVVWCRASRGRVFI
jgi:hypothetical protein